MRAKALKPLLSSIEALTESTQDLTNRIIREEYAYPLNHDVDNLYTFIPQEGDKNVISDMLQEQSYDFYNLKRTDILNLLEVVLINN